MQIAALCFGFACKAPRMQVFLATLMQRSWASPELTHAWTAKERTWAFSRRRRHSRRTEPGSWGGLCATSGEMLFAMMYSQGIKGLLVDDPNYIDWIAPPFL